MIQESRSEFTHQLQDLMQRVGVSSFKALARSSGISERQLTKLRRGEVQQIRVNVLIQLSQALQVSLTELVTTFSPVELGGTQTFPSSSGEEKLRENTALIGESQQIADLKREYQRLQAQLEQQRETLWQEFQQTSLGVLESWLLQWPTAAQKAQENPQLAAVKLLPLLRPMEQLLQQWGVEAIASVGSELPYDPLLHQLMEGTVQPGEIVKVRYTGYRQGDKLLYRAKVSLVRD